MYVETLDYALRNILVINQFVLIYLAGGEELPGKEAEAAESVGRSSCVSSLSHLPCVHIAPGSGPLLTDTILQTQG